MKKIYLLLVPFISISFFAQNKKNPLHKFDTSTMETKVLAHKSPIIDITNYNQKSINSLSFFQANKTIAQGDLQQRLTPLQTIKEQAKQSYFSKVIPLAIIHSDFESISNNALQNNLVSKDSEGYLIKTDTETSIFEKKQITLAAPLRKSTKGLQSTFNLTTSNLFNTTHSTLENIAIDFNDDQGFRNITLDQNIIINYTNIGRKILTFKITLNNGIIITREATIDIKYSNTDLYNQFNRVVTSFNSSITPDLLPYGEAVSYPGIGEYEIFLGDDGILDKPIILVDGFDPGDGRDITGLRELLNFDDEGTTSNLETLVQAEGFDLIYLNFPIYTRESDGAVIDGGADYIERNAMLLVD